MDSLYPHAARQTSLQSPADLRLRYVDAYYTVLCDPTDEPRRRFRGELEALNRQLAPFHNQASYDAATIDFYINRRDLSVDTDEDIYPHLYGPRGPLHVDPERHPGNVIRAWEPRPPRTVSPIERLIRRNTATMAPEARPMIDTFIARWHLPDDAVIDLWQYSGFGPATSGNRPLRVCKRTGYGGDFGGRPTVTAVIYPPHPLPIIYVPQATPKDWIEREADALARQVRDSILEQAGLAEAEARAAGWRAVPPRSANDEDVWRLMLRVYRAVHLAWKPGRILREEQLEQADRAPTTSQAVGQSIRNIAKTLGINLAGSGVKALRGRS